MRRHRGQRSSESARMCQQGGSRALSSAFLVLEKKYSQLEPNKSPQIVLAFDLGRKEGIERKGPWAEGEAEKDRRSYLSHALEVAHSHALS